MFEFQGKLISGHNLFKTSLENNILKGNSKWISDNEKCI